MVVRIVLCLEEFQKLSERAWKILAWSWNFEEKWNQIKEEMKVYKWELWTTVTPAEVHGPHWLQGWRGFSLAEMTCCCLIGKDCCIWLREGNVSKVPISVVYRMAFDFGIEITQDKLVCRFLSVVWHWQFPQEKCKKQWAPFLLTNHHNVRSCGRVQGHCQ